MPETSEALYNRGKYRLEWDRRGDGSLRTPFLQIVWYDVKARRNRSRSTGTTEIGAAEDALDRLYSKLERGITICSACGNATGSANAYLLHTAISDYLLARETRTSIVSIRARIAHFQDFLQQTTRDGISCDQVNKSLIEEFREWSASVPVIEGIHKRVERNRAPGTTEASVRQIAAVINHAHHEKNTSFRAGFTALPPLSVSHTPTYRSSVAELARMFRYCTDPQPEKGRVWSDRMRLMAVGQRANLLRFLQASVATWARPDAVHDLSTQVSRGQWISNARVVRLNQRGRVQTKKYRPTLPVPERFAALLDETEGFFVTVKSVRKAFEAMLDELGLPRERETGLKLIRRSIAQIVRREIGEERWPQGEMFLGHRKASVSDLYALFDPANLGFALTATDRLIEQIIALTPGAFSKVSTGVAPEPILVNPA